MIRGLLGVQLQVGPGGQVGIRGDPKDPLSTCIPMMFSGDANYAS